MDTCLPTQRALVPRLEQVNHQVFREAARRGDEQIIAQCTANLSNIRFIQSVTSIGNVGQQIWNQCLVNVALAIFDTAYTNGLRGGHMTERFSLDD